MLCIQTGLHIGEYLIACCQEIILLYNTLQPAPHNSQSITKIVIYGYVPERNEFVIIPTLIIVVSCMICSMYAVSPLSPQLLGQQLDTSPRTRGYYNSWTGQLKT